MRHKNATPLVYAKIAAGNGGLWCCACRRHWTSVTCSPTFKTPLGSRGGTWVTLQQPSSSARLTRRGLGWRSAWWRTWRWRNGRRRRHTCRMWPQFVLRLHELPSTPTSCDRKECTTTRPWQAPSPASVAMPVSATGPMPVVATGRHHTTTHGLLRDSDSDRQSASAPTRRRHLHHGASPSVGAVLRH